MNNDITLSTKSFVGVILVVLAICVGAYLYGSMGSKDAAQQYAEQVAQFQTTVVKPALAQMDTAKRIAENAVARANVAEENSKKLTGQIANLKGQTGVLQTTAAELAARNKFLADSLGKVEGPTGELINGLHTEIQLKDSVIAVQGRIIVLDSAQHQNDLVAIINLRVGVTKQTERADKAEATIRSWPMPPTPKKFLGITIPIPSRAQMFIAGVAAGIATDRALRK